MKNIIFEKCKTKRHYNRKPKCKNILGLCSYDKCRCKMALKTPKLPSKGIKVNHKLESKVVDRLKDKAKQINDVENEVYHSHMADALIYSFTARGEHSKQRAIRKAYERRIWWVLIVVVIGVLLLS